MNSWSVFLERLPGARRTLRSLFTRPAYVIISVVVLGVSIAALLNMVAVVDATLVRAPSARSPGELAFVRSSVPKGTVSYPDYVDIKARNSFFTETIAFQSWPNVVLTRGGISTPAACRLVSGNFFPTLGVAPTRGRLLVEQDDRNGAEPVALISGALAEKGQLDVGSVVTVNARPFVVVGVLPGNFRDIERNSRPDLWIPLAQVGALSVSAGPGLLASRGIQWLQVAGRLKPTVTLSGANAELQAIAATLRTENPKDNYGMEMTLDGYTTFRFAQDESARTMALISGVMWLLFALAFANFFALTLLRLFTRRRVVAIKLAMGASPAHLRGWLLGEIAVVTLLSVGVGYALSLGLLALLRLDPAVGRLVASAGISINFRSLAVVGAGAGVATFVVWLLAVRSAARVDLLSAMKESSTAPTRQTVVTGLYAAQFALALFLLATAVAFIGAMHATVSRKLAFRTENLFLLEVDPNTLAMDRPKAVAFIERLLATLRETPGVVAVGATDSPLMTPGGWVNLYVNDRDPALEADKGFCRRSKVSEGYWEAAGIALQQGRLFNRADLETQAAVGVINTAAARRFWPGREAIGQTFRQFANSPPITVVGIVADVPETRAEKIDPRVYMPYKFRFQAMPGSMTLHIAVRQDSPGLRDEIMRQLATVWPYRNLPVLRPIQEQVARGSADLRTAVRLILWIAGFATLVTGCGLYFFSAFTASQRLKDSAIRVALGATQAQVLWSHLRRYRIALAVGAGVGSLLLVGLQPLFVNFGLATPSSALCCSAVAAVPLLSIAAVGLCLPLRRVRRLDVYHTLNSSE